MYGDGLVFACAASCVQFVCKREGQVVGLAEEEAGAGRGGERKRSRRRRSRERVDRTRGAMRRGVEDEDKCGSPRQCRYLHTDTHTMSSY